MISHLSLNARRMESLLQRKKRLLSRLFVLSYLILSLVNGLRVVTAVLFMSFLIYLLIDMLRRTNMTILIGYYYTLLTFVTICS